MIRRALLLLAALLVTGQAGAATRPSTVQEGGTVVVGLWSAPPGNNDPDRPNAGPATVLRSFCESLYDGDAQGNVVPLLASAPAAVSKDKLTVAIPLRKGVLFNDGTPFDSAAVAATFERDLTLPGSPRASVLGQVASVTTDGPYEVLLHLSSPNTALGVGLVNERILSPAQLDKLGTSFGTNPVCVGPFMFQSQQPGQSITLVKSPYYYDKQDVHLDKLVFQFEGGDAAAADALRAGDIQALESVPPDELKPIEDAGFRIRGSLGYGFYFIGINLGNVAGSTKPYGNPGTPLASSPLLRQAFELAINRKQLNEVVFGGLHVPGCTAISPAVSQWFDPELQCSPYDPAQARKLVQQSGIQNPTVQLMYPAVTQDEVLAQFIQAEEAAVGINVQLDATDIATLNSRAQAGQYQAFIAETIPVKADPDWMYVNFAGQNQFGYASPRMQLVLGNARKAAAEKARRTLYDAAQQILMDDRPMIILDHTINRAAYSNRLTGVQVFPDGQLRIAFAAYKAAG